MLTFIFSNFKSIGVGFLALFSWLMIKKNVKLRQENVDQKRAITLQNKVADVKEKNKNTNGDDVVDIMFDNKF